MRVKGELARVLITVKATPQPSTSYGDTSCVAGIRIDDGAPSWIRLYPIAFRWLDGDAQFKKYDVIELEVRRKDSDTRRESYSPTQGSWAALRHVPPWKARHEIIGQLEPTTTCGLMREASADGAAPSLGLVYPTDIDRLEFEPHPKWTADQLSKMQTRIDKESAALIPMSGAIPVLLKEPEFIVRYRYRCAHVACPGHQGRILDWELTSLQNRLRHRGDDVKAGVTEKFLEQMFAPDRRSGFYMGNFELAARRGKFSVLGVYWPRAKEAVLPAPTLF
ncbi:hypothetical protein KZX37_14220 [Microbacterium sp. EYE_5]|uniref:hypothetical protein n=1 Tax=unclassified Microbacterium TaxID=2609290 RepID=UPI0020034D17|nr:MULTISPECIES: hypothetical protein [unclassified Microbacterium]MCK6081770.1 hypothetical protein [Microbacterium sp. EYE_382]MCK6087040.1 hypothetical protein [Microbacterium sp. EYE_384]MCK6124982.1 hypothetical protein [Microbacterium sp. EYE_80]MCK6127803.1 hypothetical protein [Microbacterium sp. EYE_79]MCK6142724.1 hypothetical protein [Microbacterium sp. EYE_39]